MRFLIIGLGIYGENLARDLTEMGHEVIGADCKASQVEALKDAIRTVYLIDASEESQLSVLPLRNVDLVIVAIGENFGASIKTVALLKKAGVKHIYARATDTLHYAILKGFDIDRIVTPEQRAAVDLAHELELGPPVTTLKIDDAHVVISFTVPGLFYGMKYADLLRHLSDTYSLQVIAGTRPTEHRNLLGITHPELEVFDIADASARMQEGDRLTVYGMRDKIRQLCQKVES